MCSAIDAGRVNDLTTISRLNPNYSTKGTTPTHCESLASIVINGKTYLKVDNDAARFEKVMTRFEEPEEWQKVKYSPLFIDEEGNVFETATLIHADAHSPGKIDGSDPQPDIALFSASPEATQRASRLTNEILGGFNQENLTDHDNQMIR